MKIVFDGQFGAAVGEINGGKALLITDAQGNEVQIFLTNDAAETIGKALANTSIVVPQGKDVLKLAKSAH